MLQTSLQMQEFGVLGVPFSVDEPSYRHPVLDWPEDLIDAINNAESRPTSPSKDAADNLSESLHCTT